MKLIRMINKQMEKIGFDPVSGNEVPLGGTPEGVRDDIDAKLSKGEMVIPEYAVNYHGVETYIKSIQKAQEGYQQIQDMGPVSYTHLRAHETDSYLVCRLLLEKKK